MEENDRIPGMDPDRPEPMETAVPPVPLSEDVDAAPATEAHEASVPAPPPVDIEDHNPVPVVPNPRAQGLSLVTIGCVVALVSLLVSLIAGATAGYLTARRSTPSILTPTLTTVPSAGSAAEEPVAAAAAAALPSVVNVDVRSQPSTATGAANGLPQGHPSVPQGGTGSGVAFRVTPDGGTYILTNNHVVEGADAITVTPADGVKLTATLVGRDAETDIAVIKVASKIPFITVGDSEKLVVGQMLVAIGSPFGLQHSVSSGIVSAVHRALPGTVGSDGTQQSPLVDVIQTDAAINPGNSGGALVDRTGRLVGINSAIYSDTGQNSGIGFAIPVNTAIRVAGELIAGGSAKHPFLGVEGMTVDDALAAERKLPVTEGAIIEKIIPGTGAARAGLRAGDIVVSLDGQPIRTMDDLILRVRRTKVGDKVELRIWRAGKQTTLEMVVGDKPANLK